MMEPTTIEFTIPVGGQVHIEFMNLQGKIVASIHNFYPPGKHKIEVNLGGITHSGVYIYRMRADHFTDTKLCVVQ